MVVDQDECWFSRFAQPQMHAFAANHDHLRLVQREPRKDEVDQAIACFGAVCDQTNDRFFAFADGQPNGPKAIAFLKTLLTVAQQRNQRVLIVIWDRASWHKSHQVSQWIRQHNRQVKNNQTGVRLLTCLLPAKSPWLNPMEPIWLHAKRTVVQPHADLSVKLLKDRLCAHFHTSLHQASLNLSA